MDFLIIIVIVAVAAGVIFAVTSKGKKDKREKEIEAKEKAGFGADDVPGLAVAGFPLRWRHEYKTPLGVSVCSTVAISDNRRAAVFEAVEMGIQNLLMATVPVFPNWTRAARMEDFTIGFIEPHTTNQDGSPALMANGLYQTAGTVVGIGFDRLSEQFIVLPHQAATDWRHLVYLMYSTWNEGEHYREFANDRTLAMTFTGPNDVHQHHPLPAGVAMLLPAQTAKGFAALPALGAPCGAMRHLGAKKDA